MCVTSGSLRKLKRNTRLRTLWRGSQVVRQRSAKPLFAGSIPARASFAGVTSFDGRVVNSRFRKRSIARSASLAAALLLIPAVARAQAVAPEHLEWIPVPSILPGGAMIAVVSGNPFEPGEFSIEFAMPDKYTLPPHTNPSREHVAVKSGALRVGVGRKIDLRKSAVLAAGDTASAPAGVPHWSIAEGDTHIVVTEEMGPYRIAYMSVRDEPGGHAFPNGY